MSDQWPRGLILLVGFFVVMTAFVWTGIEHNRNPNPDRIPRGPIYLIAAYIVFLLIMCVTAD